MSESPTCIHFKKETINLVPIDEFRAGRLNDFLPEWKKLTSDKTILDTVAHSHLDLISSELNCQQGTRLTCHVNSIEKVAIDKEITKLLDKGIIEECLPCIGQFVSPIFARPKKDGTFRLILNLKEFNENIEYHHFKMESIHTVTTLIRPNCYMASIDFKDAYYSVPVAVEHRKFLRFHWNNQLFQYTCFPNGLACCPRKFTKLLKPVYAELRKKGHLLVPYLDDSYLQGESELECWENVRETVTLFQKLGFIIHPVKSVFHPTQELEFLGFIVNSVTMTIRITPEKALNIQSQCTKFLHKSIVKIRDLAHIIGLLVSSLPGVQMGMLFYRHLENEKIDILKANNGNFDALCTISETCTSDLQWWRDNITHAKKKILQTDPDITIRSDASKEGWGAELNNKRTGGRWLPDETILHINELELLAILFALKSLCNDVKKTHIRVERDNTTAVCYVNNMGGSKSRPCNNIARQIWMWALEHDNWITTAHLPGKDNTVADRESRLFNDRTEWQLNTAIFSKINNLWGPLELDLFASRLNRQLDKYVAWRPDPEATYIDAFSLSWTDKSIYVFPPFSLINRCLQKISKDKAKAVIVVPIWPTQTFFAVILTMLIDNPRLLPKKDNLLTLPHSSALHPLRDKVQLMACHVSGKQWQQKEFLMKQNPSFSNPGETEHKSNTTSILKSGYNFVVKGRSVKLKSL